ncbi:putative tissue alpha-l-fucosidase [Phaeomoniella chlamydospora]|uniref:alpha-L-fucosidase n=1 Tax=Phaeomoniella chlamydospora TaxID=158046 RepID=A0A0G2DXY9_PHACM|nr:putative tissue alpha-l-fucosidase [Phaeomoniella chlamydospora]
MFSLHCLLPLLAVSAASVRGTQTRAATQPGKSVPVPLYSYFNNKSFGTYPGEAAFDPINGSYPATSVALDGSYTSTGTGVVYDFPGYRGPEKLDNVICEGQTITVPTAEYFSASILVSSDVELETVSGNVTYTYSDNTTSLSELRSLPWFAFLTINRGEIIFPYRYTNHSTNWNTSHIFEYTGALESGKSLSSITLPTTTNTTTGRLHIFAISLWKGSSVAVQSIRPTQKWTGNGTQVVELTINNAGTECISGHGLKASISAPGVETIDYGSIKRLCPGDQKTINVGVTGQSNGSATVLIETGHHKAEYRFEDVEIGLTDFTSELDSLAKHESPDWFNDAKYGIFIHWGPYSVPGWGNSSPHESYAEWFWWYSTHHPEADASDFYHYRLRTFGPDWNYDDSFANYTASEFDPKEWVDLFADAGAKYFVLTTKHHDGFANFDTGASTNRSSLYYGPHRDILGELFSAAEKYHPSLRRGTYFSLPEWFNPDFGPYGFAQLDTASSTTWPGILATNPYTNLTEPYTGRVPIDDFITDLMVPQMEALAYNYSTDIMWCDCGAANGTASFAANWWNYARSQENRQVTINSRCGLAHAADFDTPEYTTFSSAQRRKWESNQGMDPYSYGYNRATPSYAYMNASTIITTLIDMVSKNGNLLLDIGPRADGSIHATEVTNLRKAGKWIHAHEEAIFGTNYWFIRTEIEDKGIQFTQTDDAFYIIYLVDPLQDAREHDSDSNLVTLTIDAPIPILHGDKLTTVGINTTAKTTLDWKKTEDDTLKISVPKKVLEDEMYAWVFKVEYCA